jgi:hypothetical protein
MLKISSYNIRKAIHNIIFMVMEHAYQKNLPQLVAILHKQSMLYAVNMFSFSMKNKIMYNREYMPCKLD